MTNTKWMIEGRLCVAWHRCLARPHGETRPFNSRHELEFDSFEEAQKARTSISLSNAGEFRVVRVTKGN